MGDGVMLFLVYIITFRLDRNCFQLLWLLIPLGFLISPYPGQSLYPRAVNSPVLGCCTISLWLGRVLQISWRTCWSPSSATPARRVAFTWAVPSRCCTCARGGSRPSAPSSTPSPHPACPWSWPPTAGAGCTPSPWVSSPPCLWDFVLVQHKRVTGNGHREFRCFQVLCTLHSSVHEWVYRPEQPSFGKYL